MPLVNEQLQKDNKGRPVNDIEHILSTAVEDCIQRVGLSHFIV